MHTSLLSLRPLRQKTRNRASSRKAELVLQPCLRPWLTRIGKDAEAPQHQPLGSGKMI